MHSSPGAMSLLDHGARVWDAEYCTVTPVSFSDLGSLVVSHRFLAFPCFWGSFVTLCLCKESCASTVNIAGIILASFRSKEANKSTNLN